MDFKYDVDEVRDGHLAVHIKGFSVVDIYWNTDRSTSPLNREEAEKLANELKIRLESSHPVDTLNEEDYSSSMESLFELFKELVGDDECCCD